MLEQLHRDAYEQMFGAALNREQRRRGDSRGKRQQEAREFLSSTAESLPPDVIKSNAYLIVAVHDIRIAINHAHGTERRPEFDQMVTRFGARQAQRIQLGYHFRKWVENAKGQEEKAWKASRRAMEAVEDHRSSIKHQADRIHDALAGPGIEAIIAEAERELAAFEHGVEQYKSAREQLKSAQEQSEELEGLRKQGASTGNEEVELEQAVMQYKSAKEEYKSAKERLGRERSDADGTALGSTGDAQRKVEAAKSRMATTRHAVAAWVVKLEVLSALPVFESALALMPQPTQGGTVEEPTTQEQEVNELLARQDLKESSLQCKGRV